MTNRTLPNAMLNGRPVCLEFLPGTPGGFPAVRFQDQSYGLGVGTGANDGKLLIAGTMAGALAMSSIALPAASLIGALEPDGKIAVTANDIPGYIPFITAPE